MASLTIQGITKRFGKQSALSQVDLTVEDGEFCVLLGPSGCGKSTLLNIIAGLIPQDAGTVKFDQKPVDDLSPRERDVAMVFQSYALYPHMTVAQNLSFGLRLQKIAKTTIQKRVSETAQLLGIEDLLNRKPKQLSGGQRQRVAMGRALVRRPNIFLLDEPLSNLDARLRASVRIELKQLHQRIGKTIVYVTHDQVEAMTLGDKVVILNNGAVRQVGRPETIYSRPADTFVATFIGSPEMNLYGGLLIGDKDRCRFDGKGFSFSLEGPMIWGESGPVKIGIRPEDVQIDVTARDHGVAGIIRLVNDMGSEKYLLARIGEEEMTIRVPKEMVIHHGQAIHILIDPNKIHVFKNERRIDPDDV
jgi:multiple sugar transport system ATP-binding protein